MKTTREWIPPLWLALVLACTAAIAATVAAFTVNARAGAVPGAIAIVLFTAAFRQSGRLQAATFEEGRIDSAMLETLMGVAHDLASQQQVVVPSPIVIAHESPSDDPLSVPKTAPL